MMTNHKSTTTQERRGRPKTSPLSRHEQNKRNAADYRAREAQKKRDLKNKVNHILIPNITTVIDLLQSDELTKNQRIEQAIHLLQKTSKQWDQEILNSRHKDEIAASESVKHINTSD